MCLDVVIAVHIKNVKGSLQAGKVGQGLPPFNRDQKNKKHLSETTEV